MCQVINKWQVNNITDLILVQEFMQSRDNRKKISIEANQVVSIARFIMK